MWLREQAGEIAAVAGSAGRLLLKFGILLLVLFFLYRDGEAWWRDARSALQRLFGARTDDLLVATVGVIGGVTAFGLIGLFAGPVILALLLCVWPSWLASAPEQDEACAREPVPALLTAAPLERAPPGP